MKILRKGFTTGMLIIATAALTSGCGGGRITGLGEGASQIESLAFIRDGQVFTSGPRTSRLRAITDIGGHSSPTWSPDGSQVAFIGVALEEGDLQGLDNLIVSAASGDNARVLYEGEVKDGVIGWLPDGRSIAFLGNTGHDIYDDAKIHIVDVQSGEIRTASPDGIRAGNPQWSPLRDRLYFESLEYTEFPDWDVWYIDTATYSPAKVGDSQANDILPSVSPDGREIAYLSTDSGITVLLVRNLDSGRLREVVASQGFAFYRPLWSPDGSWLAFVSQGHIFRVPTSGGDPIQVTRDSANYRLVSFSPDANFVVFTADLAETGLIRDGTEVYVLDLSTGVSEQILDFGAELDVLWRDR